MNNANEYLQNFDQTFQDNRKNLDPIKDFDLFCESVEKLCIKVGNNKKNIQLIGYIITDKLMPVNFQQGDVLYIIFGLVSKLELYLSDEELLQTRDKLLSIITKKY